jgi:hypothetical protein
VRTDHRRLLVALFAGVAVVSAAGVAAQRGPADVAARLSGTWTINRELSPGFRSPGGKPGPGRGGLGGARFAVAGSFVGQGRGGGGQTGPSDLSPEELAAQAAMRQLQLLADEIRIDATADKVTFTDARGERTYAVNGKNAKIMVGASEVETKSRWDKETLKQEFSTVQAKLTQTWSVDADGRLVLIAKLESLRLRTPEQKAVFDKK